MNTLKKINNSIQEIISASTAHGLPNIVRSKRQFHKIMWIIFTVASSCFCSWLSYQSILNFLEFSVVTNIQTIYEQPSLFPTVSICSEDRFLFKNNELKSLLNSCWFNYETSCFTNPENHFEKFEVQDYGLCYRFNSGKNMTGHTIPLLYSTIGGMDDSLLFNLSSNKGLIIWVHNASIPPKRMLKNTHNGDTRFASSGTTHLIVERIFDIKLSEPYNQCVKDVNEFGLNKTLIDYINSKSEIYQQVNCLELCFDLNYIANNSCNCTKASIGKVWEQCYTNMSLSKSTQDCTMNSKTNFYKQNIVDKCSNYCPLECDSFSYPVIPTYMTSMSNSYKAEVFVYYRTLKYTLITQQATMTTIDLVSNIGGILGLFIGISFLSFVEVLEIITEVFFIVYESSKITVNNISK